MKNGMTSSDMEDGQLLQAVARGDQDALLTLHRRYVNLVYSMAWRVLQDVGLAEEVTQDIFLKLFKSLHTFDRRANFVTWLISVSRNLCIDHYRSVRKERETINRDVDPGELSPVSREVTPYKALEVADQRVSGGHDLRGVLLLGVGFGHELRANLGLRPSAHGVFGRRVWFDHADIGQALARLRGDRPQQHRLPRLGGVAVGQAHRLQARHQAGEQVVGARHFSHQVCTWPSSLAMRSICHEARGMARRSVTE